MKLPKSLTLIGLLALVATLTTGCVASSPAPASATPTQHAKASPDPATTLACTSLEILSSNIADAEVKHATGEYSDAQYAAVVNTAPMTFEILDRMAPSGESGLRPDIGLLEDAVKTSPSTTPGAKFNPNGPSYMQAMTEVHTDCQKNGTPVLLYTQSG